MGLKTFSLMMLVLNMAFLRKEEVYWLFKRLANPIALFRRSAPPAPSPALVGTATSTK